MGSKIAEGYLEVTAKIDELIVGLDAAKNLSAESMAAIAKTINAKLGEAFASLSSVVGDAFVKMNSGPIGSMSKAMGLLARRLQEVTREFGPMITALYALSDLSKVANQLAGFTAEAMSARPAISAISTSLANLAKRLNAASISLGFVANSLSMLKGMSNIADKFLGLELAAQPIRSVLSPISTAINLLNTRLEKLAVNLIAATVGFEALAVAARKFVNLSFNLKGFTGLSSLVKRLKDEAMATPSEPTPPKEPTGLSFKDWAGATASTVAEISSMLFSAVKTTVSLAISAAKTIFQFIMDGISGVSGAITGTLGSAFSNMVSSAEAAASQIGQFIKNAFNLAGLNLDVGNLLGLAIGQQDAEKKVEALVQISGKAAGFSGAQLKQFAKDLQEVSRFSDKALLEGMGTMLTFRNVQGKVFKDAVRSSMEFASALGKDVVPVMTRLGRALDDPIQGMNALRRGQIQFSREQSDAIKHLAKSGDIKGAQEAMLALMKIKSGSLAALMTDSFGGAVDQMKNSMMDLGESFGRFLFPVLTPLVKMVKDVSVYLQRGEQVWSKWSDAAGDAMKRILAAIGPDIFKMFSAAVPYIFAFGDAISNVAKNIATFVENNKEIVATITKVALVIGGIILTIATASGAFSVLKFAFGLLLSPLISLVTSFGALGLILAGPIGLAIAVLVTQIHYIVDAFKDLQKNAEFVKDLGTIWDNVVVIFGHVKDALVQIGGEIYRMIQSLFKGGGDNLGAVLGGEGGAVRLLTWRDVILEIVAALKRWTQYLAENKDVVESWIRKAVEIAAKVASVAGGFVALNLAIETVSGTIKTLLSPAFIAFGLTVKAAFDQMSDSKTTMKDVVEFIQSLILDFGLHFKKAMNSIKIYFYTLIDDLEKRWKKFTATFAASIKWIEFLQDPLGIDKAIAKAKAEDKPDWMKREEAGERPLKGDRAAKAAWQANEEVNRIIALALRSPEMVEADRLKKENLAIEEEIKKRKELRKKLADDAEKAASKEGKEFRTKKPWWVEQKEKEEAAAKAAEEAARWPGGKPRIPEESEGAAGIEGGPTAKPSFVGLSEQWKKIQESVAGGSMYDFAKATAANTAKTAAGIDGVKDEIRKAADKPVVAGVAAG